MEGGGSLSKVITFGTLKGGTGKTTVVFNTVGILASRGYKVLVIDVDPQANITSDLGVDETAECYLGVKEVFENDGMDINAAITKAPIKELPTLDIIGACMGLTSTELRVVSSPAREFLLKKFFKRNREYLNQYDYIIFDTNPSMSVINQNSFVVSDAIILVSDVGVNALKGLELFIALWQDISDKLDLADNIKGLLINKFEKNSSMGKEFMEYCNDEEDLTKIIFKNYIPMNERLPEGELERKPVNILCKEEEIYERFNLFVDELLERIKQKGRD